MASVVGLDFGNQSCYIAVARAGGIETIANDYSLRDTPSYVAFSERQRALGVNAKNQQMTNLKRTVFAFKHMLGRQFDDPVVQKELPKLPYNVSPHPHTGRPIISMNYMGKEQEYTPEQITAMLFTKLKTTAEEALNAKVKDVVISCPSYFTDCERRGLLDAAYMAGLNVLKLMNDTTATALSYGIYKQDLPAPEEKPRNVVFVDAGHSGIQVSACSFTKGKLTMKAAAYRRDFGGRYFDETIVGYFAQEFSKKYKIQPLENHRARLRLTNEVEKLKKQLSANSNRLPLNIECFMNDIDVSGGIDRTTFEELAAPGLAEAEAVMRECLEASGWTGADDVYAVEVVGGSTRIPAIKALIEKVFGKVPNTTLNADEAVARGCALQCAILSPTFKVREFSVTDIQPFEIQLTWQNDKELSSMTVFDRFHQVPFSKLLTFHRKEPFELEAHYKGQVPVSNASMGNFRVDSIEPKEDGSAQKVKVKVRVNLHGVFSVTSANLVETKEVEEEVPMEVDAKKEEENAKKDEKVGDESSDKAEGAAPDAEMKDEAAKEAEKSEGGEEEAKDAAAAATPPKTQIKKKTVTKNIELPVVSKAVGGLSRESLETLATVEASLANQDKTEAERLDVKNAVEEYIYEIRDKVCGGELEDYIKESDRESYSRMLTNYEEWLYDEGEDVEKAVYNTKLDELKKVGEPCKKRKYEHDNRQSAIDNLGLSLQLTRKMVDMFVAGEERYNHLDKDDVAKVQKAIEDTSSWMDKQVSALAKQNKYDDPAVAIVDFNTHKTAFENTCKPIMNKPKPKVEPPKEEPKKEAAEKADGDNSSSSSNKAAADDIDMKEGSSQSGGGVNGSANNDTPKDTMEVD